MLDSLHAHRRARAARTPERLLEQLESRVLLSTAPIPPLGALENAANPVVRIETALGDIDIEVFSGVAPQLAADFLGNLNRYPNSAFTRVVPGEFLQAGQFMDPTFYREEGRFRQIATTEQPVRQNLERTIGFANYGLTNDIVTPEFYINLSDNPELDTGPDAGIVFARILDDRSWDVVQQIAGLPTADLDELFLDPFFFTGPGIDVQGPFNDVPVRPGFNPGTPLANPTQAFVTITDMQLLKAAQVEQFFTDRLYYPEGFIGGENINEFVPIANWGDEVINYQVILRREVVPEVGAIRDLVVDAGQIAPNSRGGVNLTQLLRDLGQNNEDGSPFEGEPYAIEVWTTGPASANLSHFDFGTAAGEAFTAETATTWNFAEAERGQDRFSFLVWQNTTGETAEVTVTFFSQTGLTTTLTVFTPAHQRGGLNIAEIDGIPDGFMAVRLESSQPIVAALSRYATTGADQGGSTELGVTGNGATTGALAFGTVSPVVNGEQEFRQFVSFFNPGDAPTEVTLVMRGIVPGGGQTVQRTINIPANGIARFDATEIRGELGDTNNFSLGFISDAPIVARAAHTGFGDVTAAPLSDVAATDWRFAEGFMDPARAGEDLFETLAIHNPAAADTTVDIIFRFTDGTSITESVNIGAQQTVLIELHNLQPLLEQATLGRNFFSTQIDGDVPLIVQVRRYDLTLGQDDAAGGFETLGQPFGPQTPIIFGVVG